MRQLVRLAAPIVVGQIGVVLVSFADTFMIGRHGVGELAAASFVNNVTLILVTAGLGFSLGLTPPISDAEGKGDRLRAGALLREGLKTGGIIAVAAAVILAVLFLNLERMGQPQELLPLIKPYYIIVSLSIITTYFFNAFKQFTDGIMRPGVSMSIIIGCNVLNILGNYLLIYGKWGFPELGLTGAGISTLVARFFSVVAIAAYFFLNRDMAEYRRGFRGGYREKGMAASIARLGAPISGQMAMETASFSVMVIFVGWLGARALAAHQIMSTISLICYMMYMAAGSAAAIMISSFNGRKMYRELRITARAALGLSVTLIFICSGIVLLCFRPLTSMFTQSAEVSALAHTLLLPFILYQFGDSLQICLSNSLRGIQKVRAILPIAFVSYILVSIPASYLLGISAGLALKGIWFGLPISLNLGALLYYMIFRMELRKLR